MVEDDERVGDLRVGDLHLTAYFLYVGPSNLIARPVMGFINGLSNHLSQSVRLGDLYRFGALVGDFDRDAGPHIFTNLLYVGPFNLIDLPVTGFTS